MNENLDKARNRATRAHAISTWNNILYDNFKTCVDQINILEHKLKKCVAIFLDKNIRNIHKSDKPDAKLAS